MANKNNLSRRGFVGMLAGAGALAAAEPSRTAQDLLNSIPTDKRPKSMDLKSDALFARPQGFTDAEWALTVGMACDDVSTVVRALKASRNTQQGNPNYIDWNKTIFPGTNSNTPNINIGLFASIFASEKTIEPLIQHALFCADNSSTNLNAENLIADLGAYFSYLGYVRELGSDKQSMDGISALPALTQPSSVLTIQAPFTTEGGQNLAYGDLTAFALRKLGFSVASLRPDLPADQSQTLDKVPPTPDLQYSGFNAKVNNMALANVLVPNVGKGTILSQ